VHVRGVVIYKVVDDFSSIAKAVWRFLDQQKMMDDKTHPLFAGHLPKEAEVRKPADAKAYEQVTLAQAERVAFAQAAATETLTLGGTGRGAAAPVLHERPPAQGGPAGQRQARPCRARVGQVATLAVAGTGGPALRDRPLTYGDGR
jgi:hypothetical protein